MQEFPQNAGLKLSEMKPGHYEKLFLSLHRCVAFLKASPMNFSPIQTPRQHPCPTAHYHDFMVSSGVWNYLYPLRLRCLYRVVLYRHFVKMLPPQR